MSAIQKPEMSRETRGKRKIHQLSRTRLYNIWSGIRARCNNPKSNRYYVYGAKGVFICDEWERDFLSFREWALQNGYSEHLTIDRINNDGGYTPNNCRWVTYKEQANNMSTNHLLSYMGETLTISQWADRINVSARSIWNRLNLYGWSIEKTLTTPKRIICKRRDSRIKELEARREPLIKAYEKFKRGAT